MSCMQCHGSWYAKLDVVCLGYFSSTYPQSIDTNILSEVLAAAASRGLVRQNTFTKDSIKGSSEPKARPVATDESNARLITSASKGASWNQDSVRLVGGRIVRSRGEGAQMSPGLLENTLIILLQMENKSLI